ncbi:MAG: hypothetical protein B7X04_01755 [Parcubacteria group bacterium 21-54-25]|nr:MAG: hypothetical protein B7X04_01755 [Parcubacteria group bacterium 21-54-25]HQU07699.1 response regulator [Candidatus Paceibacterota bacterium]
MAAPHTIFLLDDDRFLLNMYAAKFRNAGNTVESFTSGRELLAALREKPTFDALLLDLIMPELDGFEVLETIRKDGLAEGAKIIVLSNQGQDPDIEKAKQFHVDGYIIKASAIPSEVLEKTVRIIENNAP